MPERGTESTFELTILQRLDALLLKLMFGKIQISQLMEGTYD